MSEAVLISIRPEWCHLIAHGEKTVEIRKSMPGLKPPFKCYIYCSMPDTTDPNRILEIHYTDGKIKKMNGMVIGEFICDNIMYITGDAGGWRMCPVGSKSLNDYRPADDVIKAACLSNDELSDILDTNRGYVWHISNLVNYDTLLEVSAFRKLCPKGLYCESCAMHSVNTDSCGNAALRLCRAPRSWQYVEELGGIIPFEE